MLYTIMPMEVVSAKLNKMDYQHAVQVVNVGGVMLEGIRDKDGFTIRRILSSDPAAYINGSFYPGKKLKI